MGISQFIRYSIHWAFIFRLTWRGKFLNYLGLDLSSLIVTIIAVFIAGVIRGYSGFGFAMVAVTSISLVIPPARVVPLVLILEVMASISLVPQVWRDIDWYSLRWLLAGSLLATPFGVYLLSNIPAEPMRISISCWCWLLQFYYYEAGHGSKCLADH